MFGGFGFVVLLMVVFSKTLFGLIGYVVTSGLNSHILLVPFISGYLIHAQKEQLRKRAACSPILALILFLIGLAAWAGEGKLEALTPPLSLNDSLVLRTLSFVCLGLGGGFLFLGRKWMADAAFPIGFLVFMIPLPDPVVTWLETASKLASAEAAAWCFSIAGLPVLRDGVVFQLPGMVIEVAQECSGIRSSWVLFITGLVAAHLFLKSPWRRAVLVAFVIPLGVLRNGFRIMMIGLLCVRMGPHMIHSAIHREGGPLFFAISLIPLFLLLWWLRRGEENRIGDKLPARPVGEEKRAGG